MADSVDHSTSETNCPLSNVTSENYMLEPENQGPDRVRFLIAIPIVHGFHRNPPFPLGQLWENLAAEIIGPDSRGRIMQENFDMLEEVKLYYAREALRMLRSTARPIFPGFLGVPFEVFPPHRGEMLGRWGNFAAVIDDPASGERVWLEIFDTPEQAALAYEVARGLRDAFLNSPPPLAYNNSEVSPRYQRDDMHIIQVDPIHHPAASSTRMFSTVPGRAEEAVSNLSGQTSIFLQVAAQGGLAAVAIQFSSGEKILLYLAVFCSTVGFIACFIANVLVHGGRVGRAAGVMTRVGVVATASGYISVMGVLLPENLKLWLTVIICIISIFAFAVGFSIKKKYD